MKFKKAIRCISADENIYAKRPNQRYYLSVRKLLSTPGHVALDWVRDDGDDLFSTTRWLPRSPLFTVEDVLTADDWELYICIGDAMHKIVKFKDTIECFHQ